MDILAALGFLLFLGVGARVAMAIYAVGALAVAILINVWYAHVHHLAWICGQLGYFAQFMSGGPSCDLDGALQWFLLLATIAAWAFFLAAAVGCVYVWMHPDEFTKEKLLK